jgi:hypothetical protein
MPQGSPVTLLCFIQLNIISLSPASSVLSHPGTYPCTVDHNLHGALLVRSLDSQTRFMQATCLHGLVDKRGELYLVFLQYGTQLLLSTCRELHM